MYEFLTPEDFKTGRGEMNMENQTHLNAVGEITEMLYAATHEGEE